MACPRLGKHNDKQIIIRILSKSALSMSTGNGAMDGVEYGVVSFYHYDAMDKKVAIWVTPYILLLPEQNDYC